jgi:hypothetical protein
VSHHKSPFTGAGDVGGFSDTFTLALEASILMVEIVPLAVAVTPAPTKFNFDILLATPIRVPSSKTLIPPGCNPGCCCQYLS